MVSKSLVFLEYITLPQIPNELTRTVGSGPKSGQQPFPGCAELCENKLDGMTLPFGQRASKELDDFSIREFSPDTTTQV